MKSRIIILIGILLMTFGFISCKAEVEEPEPQPTYYTVTYSSEHGTAPGAISVEENTILTESQLPALSDGTWVFKGWYVNDVKAVAGEYQVAGNVTLTAHWAATATVSYHSKFGTVPQSFDRELNQTLAEENLNAMTCSPYTFLGWYYDKDDDDNGTGTQAQAGDEISADVPLYAKWQTATVSFTSAYGTVPSIKKYTGQNLADSEIPGLEERIGYTLDGWFNGSTKLTTDYRVIGDVNFTEKWDANTYSITFKANGGTGSDYTQTVTYGTTAKLNANTFIRDGYVFDGWNRNADGSGSSYADKADFAITEANDVTLYARWDPIADETTIIEILKNMTESGTIAAKGTFNYTLINSIGNTLKNSMQKGVYVKLDLSQVSGLTSISADAFRNNSKLSGIILPDTITSIYAFTFYNCNCLREIIIPESVTTIGESAFQYCRCLTKINIPESVTTIGERAFMACEKLTEINIPESVTTIRESAFEDCYALTEINIPESVTTIEERAFFACRSLTEINIPESVTTINNEAFLCCYSLSKVTILGTPYIGIETFRKCTSLTSINLPNNINSIPAQTFEGCTSLTTLTIPDSVKSIGFNAFKGCSSLTNITIPQNVTLIRKNAFSDCPELKRVLFLEDTKIWSAYEDYKDPTQGNPGYGIGLYEEVGTMNNSEENNAKRLTIDYVDYYLVRDK